MRNNTRYMILVAAAGARGRECCYTGVNPMSNPNILSRADSYVSVEGREPHAAARKSGPAPFVTIAREAGAGGSTLARHLAQFLNHPPATGPVWRVFGGNIVDKMLAEHHLADRLAGFLPEDDVSEVMSSIGEVVGLHPNLWELVQQINETIREVARHGHVILVGRGGNFATAGLPGGIHVRFVAPFDQRARIWSELKHIPLEQARTQIGKIDSARHRYVGRTFDADVADATAYDLTINLGRMTMEEAAALVGARVQARIPAAAVAAQTEPTVLAQ